MRTYAKLAIIAIVALSILPLFARVASANSNPPNEAIWNPTILKGPLVTCVGMPTGGSGSIPVCTDLCDLVSTVTNVIYYFMGILLWIVLPIMVAWGGVTILVSRGNPGAISNGRKMIWGTVVGVLIVLAAYLIILTFVNVLGISGIGGFTSNGACIVPPYSGTPTAGGGPAVGTQPTQPIKASCTPSGGACQNNSECCSNNCACGSAFSCYLSLGYVNAKCK